MKCPICSGKIAIDAKRKLASCIKCGWSARALNRSPLFYKNVVSEETLNPNS